MLKTLFKVSVLLGLCAVFGFGADEFSEAQTTMSSADTAGKAVLGIVIKWAFSLGLPLICIAAGMCMGYMQQKKKAEQDQNTNKIYFVTAIAGVIGFFVYVIISMLISRALFGDTSYIFDVVTTFWKSAVS